MAIFNAERTGGLDGGWTMDERIWELMRTHILTTIDEARCEVERVPGRLPQRIMRWRTESA